MIKAVCNSCGYSREFDLKNAGRRFKCPKCAADVVIATQAEEKRHHVTDTAAPLPVPAAPIVAHNTGARKLALWIIVAVGAFISAFLAYRQFSQDDFSKAALENNDDSSQEPSYETSYDQPKNIFSDRKFRDTPIEFYPIGFSNNSLFAYQYRPCAGGCGCCTQDVMVVDLATDKVVDKLDILSIDRDDKVDHDQNWHNRKSDIGQMLWKHRISQRNPSVNSSRYVVSGKHTYNVDVSTSVTPAQNEYNMGPDLSYQVTVKMENGKSRVVSSGVFPDGVAFIYLGYLKSPFEDQVALLFLKSYNGFEAEHFNEVVVVGCKLDPKYYR